MYNCFKGRASHQAEEQVLGDGIWLACVETQGLQESGRAPTAAAAPNQTPSVLSAVTLRALLARASWMTEEGTADWLTTRPAGKLNSVENPDTMSPLSSYDCNIGPELLPSISGMFRIVRTRTQKKWVFFFFLHGKQNKTRGLGSDTLACV